MNGTLTKVSTNKQYTKYSYTYGGKKYSDIHVFTTLGKNSQSIAPAVSSTKKALYNMEPVCCESADIIAKINACMHSYKEDKFFGFFYQGEGYPMYIDGTRYDEVPASSNMYWETKYWPCLCVKKDGTASIRWFANKARVDGALPHCKCIIYGVHAIVFNSSCVFNERVYDNETENSMLLYDPDKTAQPSTVRFNSNIGTPTTACVRTLVGHKAGNAGIYFLVSTDCGMTVKTAANFMQDLGCDFAMNMDGNSPVQMRIKAGYGPSGKVTAGAGTTLHTAICAHLV